MRTKHILCSNTTHATDFAINIWYLQPQEVAEKKIQGI